MTSQSKKIMKWTSALSVVAILGLVLSGCGTATSESLSTSNREGGTIVLNTDEMFSHLDPALAYDTVSDDFVLQMYDTLVTYKGTTTQMIPLAASSYQVSDGGLIYTFHIRKGMTFWNGDPVTAQSFSNEMMRVLSPSVNSPGESFLDPIVVGSTAFNQKKAKTVSGISTPNAYTLVIHLVKPEPFFLYIMAMPFFSAVDESYIQKVGETAFDQSKPMGSGPFEASSITENQIVLTKNTHYWMKDQYGNAIPYLNKVIVNYNPNELLNMLNFENGKTAFLGELNPIPASQFPRYTEDPKLSTYVLTAPENSVNYFAMNSSIAPFNNLLVRQAVNDAIDKQKIIDIMDGTAVAANQPLPPGIQGYVTHMPSSSSYTYDPEKAKQLLDQAGYPNGFSTQLYSANDTTTIKIAQSIQNDLMQIGIRAQLIPSNFNDFVNQNQSGKDPMFLLSWLQDFPDASDFLNTLFNANEEPQNNSDMFNNPAVTALLNEAQTDQNSHQRILLYQKISTMIMHDAPWVPLDYPLTTLAVHTWVHGYYINQITNDPLQFIWISPSKR